MDNNTLLTIVVLLLLAVLAFVIGLVILILRDRRKADTSGLESALLKVWRESGIDRRVGEIASQVRDIRERHNSIEQMLRLPKERAAFGEVALEEILRDQLPPDMFGIRSHILDGKTPDAHIKSTVGIICIDSKFPLDNYLRFAEESDNKRRDSYRTKFLVDTRGHLKKIADDYVVPQQGTADFAFAYIPSEGVYYFLVTEAYDLLREFTQKGVQVVSPLTLSHKIELIKTGVHAKRLSEEAQQVRDGINQLNDHFKELNALWRVFFKTHLKNAWSKAEDLDREYNSLYESFEKIKRFSSENAEKFDTDEQG